MATDNEADLEIVVGARAEKGSGEKAAKSIEKEVLSTLDGGYIEVPIELKTPIKGASKRLLTLQEDVIKQWEKTFKKGYSDSAKDLNELADLWRDFKKALSMERKTSSKPAKKMNELMGAQIQGYINQKSLKKAEFTAELKKAQKKQSTKKERYSQDVIDKALEESRKQTRKKIREKRQARENKQIDEKFIEDLSRGTSSAKSKVPGADVNLGRAKQTPADLSLYTTKDSLLKSEISGYKNNWKIAESYTRTLEDEKTRENTIYEINKKKANQFAEEAKRKGRGRQTTKKQQKTITKDNALNDLVQLFKELEKGTDITKDQMYETLDIAIKKYREYQKERGTQKIGRSDEDELYQAIGAKIDSLYSQSMKKALGGTTGKEKGVGPGHENAKMMQTELHKILNQLRGSFEPVIKVMSDFAKDVAKINKSVKKATGSRKERNSQWNTERNKTASEGLSPELAKAIGNVETETKNLKRETTMQTRNSNIEARREAVADSKLEAVESTNANDGLDDEGNTQTLFGIENNTNNLLKDIANKRANISECPCEPILNSINAILNNIYKSVSTIAIEGIKNLSNKETKEKIKNITSSANDLKEPILALPPGQTEEIFISPTEKIFQASFAKGKNDFVDKTNTKRIRENFKDFDSTLPEELSSATFAKPFTGIFDKIQRLLAKVLNNSVTEVDRIIAMNEAKQEQLNIERMTKFGYVDTSRNPTKNGDKLGLARVSSLWNMIRGRQGNNPFGNIKITEGLGEIDTVGLNKALAKAIEKNMFKAQSGGIARAFSNVITGGLSTIWQPSLEKSRAQVEALNDIMANLRDVIGTLTQDISKNEQDLSGLIESGRATRDINGNFTGDAGFLVGQIEDSKLALKSVLADVSAINQIIEKSGGNTAKIFKRISFSSKVLKDQNKIIQNINAGLNKNGRAFKFQTRAAEILNYTFQLMGRSVGQMWKNWMAILNPINLIKQAFGDFQGYNVKWQRTINVIKYNIRTILRPFMDWVAQKLVNVIGFIDIISMKVQEAFGKLPISLFDQAAANSEKIHEELEAATNVTAGFDELHDIGSDNSGANDLLGEIYKPQLSEKWKELAEQIGDWFAGIIKGDLGFGEAMLEILRIAINGINTLWTENIKPFLTNTLWPFIKDGFWDLLGTLLKYYLGWKLLKVAGKLLWDAITSHFTVSAFGGLLGKVGSWITTGLSAIGGKILEAGGFGSQLIVGFEQMLHGQGLIGAFKGGGTSLGSVFAQAFTAVLGVSLWNLATGFFANKEKDDAVYNAALMSAGGNKKDKKNNTLLNAAGAGLTGAATGAVTGMAIGGTVPIVGHFSGAVIGAIIGGFTGIARVLKEDVTPAAEVTKVAIDNMNYAFQSTSYYEGTIKGLSTHIDDLQIIIDSLSNKLKINKQSIIEEGLSLDITKGRMNELITAVENGTYSTDMLTGKEIELNTRLEDLAGTQDTITKKTEELEKAKIKLQKAEMDSAILADVEAGKYEVAAARMEVAIAQGLYTEEEAMTKRKQMYAIGGEECREALLSMADDSMQKELEQNLKEIDKIVEQHQSFWQSIGDTIAEIFTLGNATTWTYNGREKAGTTLKIQKQAVGTNYVEADGLAYLHQGEAIIPKKYNQPYQPPQALSSEEREYMSQMIATMRSLDSTMQSGIPVRGEFKQRGSDLVAVVQRGQNKNGNQPLSNPAYAR